MYLLYKYGSIASVQIFSPFKPRCVKKKVSGKLLVGKGGGGATPLVFCSFAS